jgi:hypothetical protein
MDLRTRVTAIADAYEEVANGSAALMPAFYGSGRDLVVAERVAILRQAARDLRKALAASATDTEGTAD